MRIKIIQEGTDVYVPIDIVSAALGKKIIPLNFLADTGADKTTIAPLDAADIDINFKKLKKSTKPAIGVGGKQKCEYQLCDVYFRFHAQSPGKFVYAHLNEIDVIKPGRKLHPMPSLLGTDLLKNFRFTYNSHAKLETK